MKGKKYSREDALELLISKARQKGETPRRADFTPEEIVAIKAFLGPFPRALEKAGLKEPPAVSTLEKNRLKRQAKKAAARTQKKEHES